MLNSCQRFHSHSVDLHTVLSVDETEMTFFVVVDSSSILFVSGRVTFSVPLLAFLEHSLLITVC